jgi:hypothetical protein
MNLQLDDFQLYIIKKLYFQNLTSPDSSKVTLEYCEKPEVEKLIYDDEYKVDLRTKMGFEQFLFDQKGKMSSYITAGGPIDFKRENNHGISITFLMTCMVPLFDFPWHNLELYFKLTSAYSRTIYLAYLDKKGLKQVQIPLSYLLYNVKPKEKRKHVLDSIGEIERLSAKKIPYKLNRQNLYLL